MNCLNYPQLFWLAFVEAIIVWFLAIILWIGMCVWMIMNKKEKPVNVETQMEQVTCIKDLQRSAQEGLSEDPLPLLDLPDVPKEELTKQTVLDIKEDKLPKQTVLDRIIEE
jgi:hypothetical protein